jgi:cell division septation protein DedD
MNRPANLARARPAAPAPAASPEKPAERAVESVASRPTPPAAASVATGSLGSGARLVQLGAFDSEGSTRKAWEQLVQRHPDLLGSKQLYVERTTANARVFYRLRVAGFQSSDQTRAMCEALRARGIDCIPVTLN